MKPNDIAYLGFDTSPRRVRIADRYIAARERESRRSAWRQKHGITRRLCDSPFSARLIAIRRRKRTWQCRWHQYAVDFSHRLKSSYRRSAARATPTNDRSRRVKSIRGIEPKAHFDKMQMISASTPAESWRLMTCIHFCSRLAFTLLAMRDASRVFTR